MSTLKESNPHLESIGKIEKGKKNYQSQYSNVPLAYVNVSYLNQYTIDRNLTQNRYPITMRTTPTGNTSPTILFPMATDI